MPFKSQAQRRKFAQLLVEGKISPQTFEEWNRETGARKLPQHVKRKAMSKRTARPKRKAASKRRARSKPTDASKRQTGGGKRRSARRRAGSRR